MRFLTSSVDLGRRRRAERLTGAAAARTRTPRAPELSGSTAGSAVQVACESLHSCVSRRSVARRGRGRPVRRHRPSPLAHAWISPPVQHHTKRNSNTRRRLRPSSGMLAPFRPVRRSQAAVRNCAGACALVRAGGETGQRARSAAKATANSVTGDWNTRLRTSSASIVCSVSAPSGAQLSSRSQRPSRRVTTT